MKFSKNIPIHVLHMNTVLGGMIKPPAKFPTHDFMLGQVAHAMAPWSAFAPFALGRLFLSPRDEGVRGTSARAAVLVGFAVVFVAQGMLVAKVDAEAVAETWGDAGRWAPGAAGEVCVFLMGGSLAEPRELARAIAEQRRKTRANLTLIPVDARNWDAHIPVDAPEVARNVVERLKRGN